MSQKRMEAHAVAVPMRELAGDDDEKSLDRQRSYSRTLASRRAGRLGLPAALAFVFLVILSLRTVPPAHVGIAVTVGSVHAHILESGVHLTNPLCSVVLFSTKTTLFEQANHVPTKEGLTVDLDVAVLFHVRRDSARDIYLGLGQDFISVLIKPELSSAVRGLTSEADAKALYTSGRSEMQKRLKAEVRSPPNLELAYTNPTRAREPEPAHATAPCHRASCTTCSASAALSWKTCCSRPSRCPAS